WCRPCPRCRGPAAPPGRCSAWRPRARPAAGTARRPAPRAACAPGPCPRPSAARSESRPDPCLVFLRQFLAREQRVVEAEAGEIADAHRIEHAVQMVDLVLHHAGVKVLHVALERVSVRVEPGIAQALEAR